MEHEAYRDLISLACDGRLEKSDQDRLDGHLKECGQCREFAEAVKAASASLQNATAPRSSEAFVQSVMDRLPAAAQEEPLPLRILVPVFGAALAMLLIVWTPMAKTAIAGPDSLVTANFDEPQLELWEWAP